MRKLVLKKMFLLTVFSAFALSNAHIVAQNSGNTRPPRAWANVTVLAERAVRAELANQGFSPSTAQFPRASEQQRHVRALGNGRYSVESWVEYQNRLGARVRTNFTCIIVVTGNTGRVESLRFH